MWRTTQHFDKNILIKQARFKKLVHFVSVNFRLNVS